MLCIEYITLGWLFFFFFQSQANQIPFFCFLSRKWQTFSNYRRLWASAWKLCPVFSCCFSHAIFGLQEMPRTYWCCGWSWTSPSLPLSRRVLLPPQALWSSAVLLLTWEHAQDLSLETCCLPVNLGALVPKEPRSRQSPGGGRPPGIRPQFLRSHRRNAFSTWPCTHLSSS